MVKPPAYKDLRKQPIDPWAQMWEEQKDLALKPEHPWYGGHYLWWALIACTAILGTVGVVLL